MAYQEWEGAAEIRKKAGELAMQERALTNAGQLAVQKLASENQLAMAGMQYGPGGQGDRNMLAQSPLINANATHANAQTNALDFQMGVARETRPSLISDLTSTHNLNTAFRTGKTDEMADTAYSKFKTTNLAKPEWANTPYTPTVNPDRRGWAQKLWAGDLYNPFSDKNAAEESYAAKVKRLNAGVAMP